MPFGTFFLLFRQTFRSIIFLGDTMPKEKKKSFDEKEEQTTLFYYEIIGSVVIILSITALGKLGKIGKILTVLSKVLFGDWYFIVLLFCLFLGIYNLFMHKRFDFTNHRFIGFVFLLCSILLFSHFSIHNYVLESNKSYISGTISIYKSFINSGNDSSLGGGVIGATAFYLIYYLLGTIGVVLCGIILAILSISLIFNTPFLDISKWVGKKFGKVGSGVKSFRKFFKYEVGKDMQTKTKEYIKLPLSIFKNTSDEDIYRRQEEDTLIILNRIKECFKRRRIIYNYMPYIVSYFVSTLYFEIEGEIDVYELLREIKKIINIEMLASYDKKILIIQVNNNRKRMLSVRKVLLEGKNDNSYVFPIGIDYQNKVVDININQITNMMVIGISPSETNNFIRFLIALSFFKYKSNEIDIFAYDSLGDLSIYTNVMSLENDIYSFLDGMKKSIDEWNDFLSLNGLFDYGTYLNKLESYNLKYKINKKIIIINGINEDMDIAFLEKILLYMTQLSKKVGVTLIYVLNNSSYTNSAINGMFETKILFKLDENICNQFTSSDDVYKNALYLEGSGDSYFITKRSIKRLMVPNLSSLELEEIYKTINKKIE